MAAEEDDPALVALVAAGDRAAFGRLMERHGAAMRRLARLLTSSDDAADEALQAALIGAFRGAPSYRADSSVKSWLSAIVRNAAWHERARRRKADHRIDADAPLEQLGAAAGWGSVDPELAAMRAEDLRRVLAAMESLRESDREILVLRDVEQLSGDEVAKLLAIDIRAMKSRLHRARLKLAVALRTGDDHGRE